MEGRRREHPFVTPPCCSPGVTRIGMRNVSRQHLGHLTAAEWTESSSVAHDSSKQWIRFVFTFAERIFGSFIILLPPLFLLVAHLTPVSPSLSAFFFLSLPLLSLEISYVHALPLLVPCLGLRCCLTGSCLCLCSESSNDPC